MTKEAELNPEVAKMRAEKTARLAKQIENDRKVLDPIREQVGDAIRALNAAQLDLKCAIVRQGIARHLVTLMAVGDSLDELSELDPSRLK